MTKLSQVTGKAAYFMKCNRKAAITSLVITSVLAISSGSVFAEAPTFDITTALTASVTTIVTNTLAAFTAVAPIGITIFGAMLAWTYGKKFFKMIAK